MKRLIKKANEEINQNIPELNQMMIDYFKNQNIVCHHNYHFHNSYQSGDKIHQVSFELGFKNQTLNIKDYLNVLAQEASSNQLNHLDYIIKSVILHIIQTKSDVFPVIENDAIHNIVYLPLSNYKSIIRNYTIYGKKDNNDYPNQIPYTMDYFTSGDSYLTMSIVFFLQISQNKEDHIQEREKAKQHISDEIKRILHETDFLESNFFDNENLENFNQILFMTELMKEFFSSSQFSSSKSENNNYTLIQLSKYFTFDEFYAQYRVFFLQETINALKHKFWNSANIWKKQEIRNTIKDKLNIDLQNPNQNLNTYFNKKKKT